MDEEARQATVHRVAKSQTRLKRLNIHTHRYTHIRIMVFKIRCASLYFHESFNQDFNLFTFSVIKDIAGFKFALLLRVHFLSLFYMFLIFSLLLIN